MNNLPSEDPSDTPRENKPKSEIGLSCVVKELGYDGIPIEKEPRHYALLSVVPNIAIVAKILLGEKQRRLREGHDRTAKSVNRGGKRWHVF